MTTRLLVVPAAGRGSRLGGTTPKALVEVAGRTMLDRVTGLHRPWISHFVVVAHPSFADRVRRWASSQGPVDVIEQAEPTGMLDAIMLAAPSVERIRPDWIWITWCDQVGVLPATLATLADTTAQEAASFVMPTV